MLGYTIHFAYIISIFEILSYLKLYFSKYVNTNTPRADGTSITIAITAPLLKLGIDPNISVYKNVDITLNSPPTDAGIPKSVKLKKND